MGQTLMAQTYLHCQHGYKVFDPLSKIYTKNHKFQDILSKLPTETASGRADLSDQSSIEDTLKHHHGGYYGGYSKPSYGGYYGGYSNNYYNPYNSPYNAYNPYAVNPYAYNPYAAAAYNPYAYTGQIGTITGATSTQGTTTGTTGIVNPVRTEES